MLCAPKLPLHTIVSPVETLREFGEKLVPEKLIVCVVAYDRVVIIKRRITERQILLDEKNTALASFIRLSQNKDKFKKQLILTKKSIFLTFPIVFHVYDTKGMLVVTRNFCLKKIDSEASSE